MIGANVVALAFVLTAGSHAGEKFTNPLGFRLATMTLAEVQKNLGSTELRRAATREDTRPPSATLRVARGYAWTSSPVNWAGPNTSCSVSPWCLVERRRAVGACLHGWTAPRHSSWESCGWV